MARLGEWKRSVRQLLVVAAVLVVFALAAGWLFARGDAPSAARLLLGEQVVEEPLAEDGPGPDPQLPTSGPDRGEVVCGVVDDELAPQTQVSSLAAGVVIIQHDPQLPATTRNELGGLVERRESVLVAPREGLDTEVVATAWRHRFEPDDASLTELDRFVVGYSGRGPDPARSP